MPRETPVLKSWADLLRDEPDILYINGRFVDKTALSWSLATAIVIQEAHLTDWKTGAFRLLKRFVQNESD